MYNSDRLTPVTLANIKMVNDPNGDGLISSFVNQAQTYAQIIPERRAANLDGQQQEINEITHKAIMRWTDWSNVNQFAYIVQDRVAPDQSVYTRLFKIHDSMEAEGSEWWIEVGLELIRQVM
jgi:hypothetical protein